ncbi:MAG TPA: site-2 protease family protein, partial [Candidatus Mailhella excrementigallinarum]|nr:site-2 protease family protein [Candidatus Mailhella excrementigallinarum]
QGLWQTWNVIDITAQSIRKLVTGSVAAENVGGPLMIAEMLGKSVEHGIMSLIMLAAFISVNLGLLNLLPIPVLDGGLILFCLIEMVVRRPVPEKIQEYAMRAGVVFLICLMLFATFNDVKRWFVQPEITQPEGAADGNQPPVKP